MEGPLPRFDWMRGHEYPPQIVWLIDFLPQWLIVGCYTITSIFTYDDLDDG
jgi:hypothetical protein